jgi:microcystin-dependent protein
MSEPFVAEIRIFAGNFAPKGWAFCDGQLLPSSQNEILTKTIGNIYGGDGRSTIALPNLQGRVPMHPGPGPGLTPRKLGQRGGVDTVTLSQAEMPSHNHTFKVTRENGTQGTLTPSVELGRSRGGALYQTNTSSLTPMSPAALLSTGGSQPHNNTQPFLALNFIIALTGLEPVEI